MPRRFPELLHPIVQAPLAGGPSKPELTAAVSRAGGLGFLAAGYKSADAVRSDIATTRELTSAPFGLNLFFLSETPIDHDRVSAYAHRLEPEARRYGIELGEARFEDDAFDVKLALVLAARVPIVSFTFGRPPSDAIERLHERDIAV